MKKPKTKWQLEVRNALDCLGMTYKELAEAVGTKEGYIRQLMCGTYAFINDNNSTKTKITEYLRERLKEE